MQSYQVHFSTDYYTRVLHTSRDSQHHAFMVWNWTTLPLWGKLLMVVLGTVLLLFCCAAGIGWWYYHPMVTRNNGIRYGERHNKALYFDIIQPAKPHGAGILVMVSGSWKSKAPGTFPTWLAAPFLRHGYTVFPIYHMSQPDATVMEIIEDVHQATRFIRYRAMQYGIDPQRIGVTGGSSGGHLSLMLATGGGSSHAVTGDPSDRASSNVQAVAIFFPVTDLLNLGTSTENPGDGGPPKNYVTAFGPDATKLITWKEIGKSCSPIYHITKHLPPIRIHHGDADTLVPLEQSEWFQNQAKKMGHDVDIVIHSHGGHGWPTMFLDIFSMVKWFDKHLQAN